MESDLGRLGHGDQQHQLLPKKVEALADQRVIAVSAGNFHSLALTADGAVWSWGNGLYGRLGSRTSCCPRRSRPLLASASFVAVSARTSAVSPSLPTAPSLPGATVNAAA